MTLTEPEKLALLMLADIHEHIGVKNGSVEAGFVREAISSGNTWALSERYAAGAYARTDHSHEKVEEVRDILEMWSSLEWSCEHLKLEERKELEKENCGPVRIEGFDGHEDQLGVIRFMIERMEYFESLKGKADIDSHSPTKDVYARMVRAFKPIWQRVVDEGRTGGLLTAAEIMEVLQARRWRAE
jgi:uncharacterized protein YfbU (UPF0304 family)